MQSSQKSRLLRNGLMVQELEKPVTLKIHTKCPRKWMITDLETGEKYKATGETELYKMWKKYE
tara:strand:+ start:10965 stop:11153 length:189 start_codon:yes stop_codon:yes gene_type:complete